MAFPNEDNAAAGAAALPARPPLAGLTLPSAGAGSSVQAGRELRSQTSRSIAWVFSSTAAIAFSKVILFAGLARLLQPADFGLFAATTTVLGILEIVGLMGVGPALIQRAELTREHISTALFMAACLGGVATGVMWLAAGPIAASMKIAGLKEVLQIVSPIFFIRSLSMVGNGLASRDMNFSLMSRVEIFSYIFGYGLVSIVLALCGFGPWALILGYIAQQALSTLLITLPYGKILSLRCHFRELKEMLGFCSGISLANIANYIAQQGDYYIVGRTLGVVSLGFYNRAYNLMLFSVAAVINTLDRVLFPALAKMQHDRAGLAKALRTSTSLVWIIYLPLSMVLTVCSRDIVDVLLGHKWLGMTRAFYILTFGLVFRAGYKMAGTVLKVQGKVMSFAVTQAVYGFMVVAGAAVGSRHGIEGVATGVFIALGVNYFLLNLLGFLSVQQRFSSLYRDLFASLALTAVVFVASSVTQHALVALGWKPIFRLACVGTSVTGAYALAFWVLFRKLLGEETREFLSTTWQGVAKQRSKIGRRLRKLRTGKPQLVKA